MEVTADIDGGRLNRVVFAAQTGNGKWRTLGSADHAPYKVTDTIAADVPAGTTLRYKAVVVDSTGRTASTTATSTTGTPPVPEIPTATSRDHAIVHYKRTDGAYGDWGVYAWGDLADGESTNWPDSHPFIGRDAYGAFAYVKLKPGASNVGFLVIDKDGNKDVSADRTIDVTRTGEIWIEQGSPETRTEKPTADYPPQDTTKAVIHYHRTDGDYTGWGLHTWTGAANPTDWSKPLEPVETDAYGAVFEVPLKSGASSLSYIIHKGDEKDLPTDRSLDLTADGHEVWLVNGQEKHLLPQPARQCRRARPVHLQGGLDRPEHRRLERLRGRRLHPAPRLLRRLGHRRERHPDRRAEVAAPVPDHPHRRPEGHVPAPRLVHRLVGRPA